MTAQTLAARDRASGRGPLAEPDAGAPKAQIPRKLRRRFPLPLPSLFPYRWRPKEREARRRTSYISETMPRDVDYYALLGVTRDATETEIRERFRALAREAHPDRAPRDKKAEAEAHFQELTEAVNVLTNPERRKAYDFEQVHGGGRSRLGGRRRFRLPELHEPGNRRPSRSKQFAEAAGNFRLAVHRNPQRRARPSTTSASPRPAPATCAPRSGRSRRPSRSIRRTSASPRTPASIITQAGLLVKAEKAYQEALRWDPSAAEVRRALDEDPRPAGGERRSACRLRSRPSG